MPLVFFGCQAVIMRPSLCEPRRIINIMYARTEYVPYFSVLYRVTCILRHMKKTLDDDGVFYPSKLYNAPLG